MFHRYSIEYLAKYSSQLAPNSTVVYAQPQFQNSDVFWSFMMYCILKYKQTNSVRYSTQWYYLVEYSAEQYFSHIQVY